MWYRGSGARPFTLLGRAAGGRGDGSMLFLLSGSLIAAADVLAAGRGGGGIEPLKISFGRAGTGGGGISSVQEYALGGCMKGRHCRGGLRTAVICGGLGNSGGTACFCCREPGDVGCARLTVSCQSNSGEEKSRSCVDSMDKKESSASDSELVLIGL